jgi:hypothetical protein
MCTSPETSRNRYFYDFLTADSGPPKKVDLRFLRALHGAVLKAPSIEPLPRKQKQIVEGVFRE